MGRSGNRATAGFTNGWFAVQAVKLVNALLDPDRAAVKQMLGELSALAAGQDDAATRGRLSGLADVARWGLERIVALESHERFGVGVGTREHRFLACLDSEGPMLNGSLLEKLDLDPPAASKVGRKLREGGFVIRRKLGREVLWELTPRGETALRQLDESERRERADWLSSARDKPDYVNEEASVIMSGRAARTTSDSPHPPRMPSHRMLIEPKTHQPTYKLRGLQDHDVDPSKHLILSSGGRSVWGAFRVEPKRPSGTAAHAQEKELEA